MSWTWLYFRVGNLLVDDGSFLSIDETDLSYPVQLYPCPSITIISTLVTVIFVDSLNTLPLPAPPL